MASWPVRPAVGGDTLVRMGSPGSVWSLATAMAPLRSSFGDRLTLCRDGNVVQWSYDDQSVVAELRADGVLEVSFVDRRTIDAVSDEPTAAVYRRVGGITYRLSAESGDRLVNDMVAFFSGTREPRFTFVSAFELEQAS